MFKYVNYTDNYLKWIESQNCESISCIIGYTENLTYATNNISNIM